MGSRHIGFTFTLTTPKDVITYTVTSINPFKVKECVPGVGKLNANPYQVLICLTKKSGGLCGAVRVDEAFEAHMAGRAKLRISSFNQSDYNEFVVDNWEKGAKRNFSDASDPREFHLRPPMKLLRARDRILNKNDFVISRWEWLLCAHGNPYEEDDGLLLF